MLSATQLAVGRPVAGQRRTTQRPVRGLVSMRASATLSQDVLVLDKCTPLGARAFCGDEWRAGGDSGDACRPSWPRLSAYPPYSSAPRLQFCTL